jgi:hypothetical protein
LTDIVPCRKRGFPQALSIYSVVKQAARDNVHGAEVISDELQNRFATERQRKTAKQQ